MNNLKKANKEFRNSNYQEAIRLYQEILTSHPDLSKLVIFNLSLALKKLSSVTLSVASKHHLNVVTLEYITITESCLFDHEYYRVNYPRFSEVSTDPILHYITEGAKISYNPNSQFDTAFYYRKHPIIMSSGENPLVHFINHKKNGRIEELTAPIQILLK